MTNWERSYALCVMLVGVVLSALVFGVLAQIITEAFDHLPTGTQHQSEVCPHPAQLSQSAGPSTTRIYSLFMFFSLSTLYQSSDRLDIRAHHVTLGLMIHDDVLGTLTGVYGVSRYQMA